MDVRESFECGLRGSAGRFRCIGCRLSTSARWWCHRFCFFHEPQRRAVQIAQLRLLGFIFCKLYEVAAIQEFAQALLLVAREEFSALQFVQELLGRAFRCMKIKPFFQVPTNGVGNQDTKFTGLAEQGERLLELLFCADVRWNDRNNG